MTVRSSSSERWLLRSRLGRRERAAGRDSAGLPQDPERPIRRRITGQPAPAPAPRRALQSELGETTYSCSCGFIFQAPVLTSVACPHCGTSQAW